MKLKGNVAWVADGSSEVGAAVARELASSDVTVAISARRHDQLQDVAGGHMLAVPADVTDAASVSAAARVRQELRSIDLAVLSAGYWKQMDPADWDAGVFDQHLRVNLTGMSNAIAAVLPGMLQRHHGVIAGIASIAGYRGLAGSVDTLTFRPVTSGTEVTYRAEFAFKGPTRIAVALLKPGNEAEPVEN